MLRWLSAMYVGAMECTMLSPLARTVTILGQPLHVVIFANAEASYVLLAVLYGRPLTLVSN
jgi:hypothetical protein